MSASDPAARLPVPLLVFTDLDGTLLDHETYDHSPARPALSRLKAIGAGVVLASSKTAAEIAPLRSDLGLEDWPAIVENGGGVLAPGQSATDNAGNYRELRDIIGELPMGAVQDCSLTATENGIELVIEYEKLREED